MEGEFYKLAAGKQCKQVLYRAQFHKIPEKRDSYFLALYLPSILMADCFSTHIMQYYHYACDSTKYPVNDKFSTFIASKNACKITLQALS
jgi:hypothetical protein